MLAETAFKETDELEENAVALSDESWEKLSAISRRDGGMTAHVVAQLIEREHELLLEKQAGQAEPEVTPAENLDRWRRVQAKLGALADEWVRDAEAKCAQSGSSQAEPLPAA